MKKGRLILLVGLCLCTLNLYSQRLENVDIKNIFYMQLFLDKGIRDYAPVVKNDSLYFGYKDYVDFSLVKLKTKNIKEIFQFYSLDYWKDDKVIRFMNRNNISNDSNEQHFYGFSVSATGKYILCINKPENHIVSMASMEMIFLIYFEITMKV